MAEPPCSSTHPANYSGFGGCLPYLASYNAANLASSSGWQTKHCDSGRSCFAHQSPLALNSFAILELHCAQTSSGTPCSLHHQLSCVWVETFSALSEGALLG